MVSRVGDIAAPVSMARAEMGLNVLQVIFDLSSLIFTLTKHCSLPSIHAVKSSNQKTTSVISVSRTSLSGVCVCLSWTSNE